MVTDIRWQSAVSRALQLPGSDQHPDERATGTDSRRAGQADRAWNDRAAVEHHRESVGNERQGSWPGRGQPELVLFEYVLLPGL